ncbi:MAG: hemin uptake protein HemP [Rhodospirillales bacterium]|nr:hemin uptake protein HemP [Rhodospirillales bacterium]
MTNRLQKFLSAEVIAQDDTQGAGWAFCLVECSCGRPRVSSKQLFPAGHTEMCIEHEGLEYCLRITKQKKLILYR